MHMIASMSMDTHASQSPNQPASHLAYGVNMNIIMHMKMHDSQPPNQPASHLTYEDENECDFETRQPSSI